MAEVEQDSAQRQGILLRQAASLWRLGSQRMGR